MSQINGRKSAIATVITCYNCKRPGHIKKDCNHLNQRPGKSENVKNSKKKWCTYHRRNGHSNEDCYQQQSETKSGNIGNNRKIGCHYRNSASHSNEEFYHQRGSKYKSSSSVLMVNVVRNKKPLLLIVTLLTKMQSFAVTVKEKTILMKVTTSRILHHLRSGLLSWRIICRYCNKKTDFNFWLIQDHLNTL